MCMYYSSVDITKFPLWEFCSLLFRRPFFSCFLHSQRDPHILFWTRRLFGSNLQFFFDLSAPCGQCSFHCVCLQNKKPQFPPWELRPVNQLCAFLLSQGRAVAAIAFISQSALYLSLSCPLPFQAICSASVPSHSGHRPFQGAGRAVL